MKQIGKYSLSSVGEKEVICRWFVDKEMHVIVLSPDDLIQMPRHEKQVGRVGRFPIMVPATEQDQEEWLDAFIRANNDGER